MCSQRDVAELLEVEQPLRLELPRQDLGPRRPDATGHGNQRVKVAPRDVHRKPLTVMEERHGFAGALRTLGVLGTMSAAM
jgi:hypothetical protein